MPVAADDQRGHAQHDAEGRLLAGSLPGWGLSWWLDEQGLLTDWEQLSMSARLERMNDYWRAVSEGWWPSVPRAEWVGSCHPWEPGG
jgi:hypothetical protein